MKIKLINIIIATILLSLLLTNNTFSEKIYFECKILSKKNYFDFRRFVYDKFNKKFISHIKWNDKQYDEIYKNNELKKNKPKEYILEYEVLSDDGISINYLLRKYIDKITNSVMEPDGLVVRGSFNYNGDKKLFSNIDDNNRHINDCDNSTSFIIKY